MSVPWGGWPPNANDGSGLVKSVFGRTGIVVAMDGDYAGSSITNDSSVPGGTVTEALDNILARYVSAYIQAPATADAFDDEFVDGSPDLAVRGYTVVNAATGVAQTRSGAFTPWGADPAAGTYFSSLSNSWIYIRAPVGIQLDIYKTITLAVGDTYFARMVGSFNLATAVNGRFNELGLYGASGAQLDNNNRVYTTVRDDTTASFLQLDSGRITGGGAFTGAGGRLMLGGHDIRGIYTPSATNASLFYLDAQNGEPKGNTVAGAPALATLTRFAVRNLFSNSGSNNPQVWSIDFFRKKTANAWII